VNNYKNANLIATGVMLLLTSSYSHAGSPLVEKKSGRKPASELSYRQAGVPVFSFVKKVGSQTVKVKDIPVLDIGEERELKSQDYKPNLPPAKEFKLKAFTKGQSPEFIKVDPEMTKYFQAGAPQKLAITPAVNLPVVAPLQPFPTYSPVEPTAEVQNLVEIKPEEYKMVQALIFHDFHKKYDLAMSLFVELMDTPRFKQQATYHYAMTALSQKLYSEFRHKMIKVATEATDQTLKKMAVESLVQNIKLLEVSDIGKIDPLVAGQDIDTTLFPAYLLKKAKYELERGNLGEVEESLTLIQTTAPEYKEGVLLKAIFNYRQGQVDIAIQDLEILWPLIETQKKDSVRNLAALTLARLYFQKSNYADAYKNYLRVDKSSGQWLQSMVEQAWTQVLSGDNIGAAGNMFALHTNYFQKAYAPETYIVRTVGYLNLCQYGDGVSVLGDLKKKYSSIQSNIKSFQSRPGDDMKYYDLVKTWIKNVHANEVEGLPRSFVVELARHPHYTLVQKQINNYEDENSRFNKITVDLIRNERTARLEMLRTKNAYTAAKTQNKSASEIQSAEKKFLAIGTEHAITAKAREGIKKMREAAVLRLVSEKQDLVTKAAANLKVRYAQFASVLDSLIDQNEVLSYEIYSGAGEHIRYQMAGGETEAKDTRNLASEKNKDGYEWKFKEEVWEDEIGHFRSSLKNVCPKEELAEDSVPERQTAGIPNPETK
jgi:hypothetical protein